MINESDVKAKTDDELLNIWANQNDYVPKIIPWVKAEIEKRNLDTSGIHVRTLAEITEQEERESDKNFVRMLTFIQGGTGAFLIVFAVPTIVEQLSEYFRYQIGELNITIPLIMLLIGLVLITYAIGVWNERKWAIISGLIVYSIITIWNIAGTTISGLALVKSSGTKGTIAFFIVNVVVTFLCICLVLAFNRLRKKINSAEKKSSN